MRRFTEEIVIRVGFPYGTLEEVKSFLEEAFQEGMQNYWNRPITTEWKEEGYAITSAVFEDKWYSHTDCDYCLVITTEETEEAFSIRKQKHKKLQKKLAKKRAKVRAEEEEANKKLKIEQLEYQLRQLKGG